MRFRLLLLFVSVAFELSLTPFAQTAQEVPAAPSPRISTVAAASPQFPPQDPLNFTAAAPTRDAVDAFLRVTWGYDPDRI